MVNPLNIPLSSRSSAHATRRIPRRVARLIGGALLGLLLLFCTWRLYVTRDTTSDLGPTDSLLSVRFFKSPHLLEILTEKLEGKQVLPGFPLRMEDFLLLSDKNLTLWVGNSGEINGITFDRPLPEKILSIASSYKFTAINKENKGFIGSEEPVDQKGPQGILRFLRRLAPWADGEITERETGATQTLAITTQSIRFRWSSDQQNIPDIYGFSSETITQADTVFSVSQDKNSLSPSFLALSGASGEFNTAIEKGLRILTGSDTNGTAKALIFPGDSLTDEGARAIATSLFAKENLSTQRLTFPDGTSAAELRSDKGMPTETTDIDGNHVWVDASGNHVFLKKDTKNELVIIANRPLITLSRALSHVSACFPGANSFTSTSLITQGAVKNWFTQMSWDDNEVHLCW